MAGLIDSADRAYWWLRGHPPVAAGIAIATALIIVALATAGGSQAGKAAGDTGLPSSAVAMVGDLPITKAQLDHWRDIYVNTSTDRVQPTAKEVNTAVFELLAGSAWIAQEARRENVSVSSDQVVKAADDFLDNAAKTATGTRSQVLDQIGKSEADVRYQQRSALLAAALQKQVVEAVPPPTDAAVKAAYAAEPGRWARPSQRDVSAIIAPDKATATRALAALKGGKSFASVTKQYSSDAGLTSTGGKLKNLRPGTSDPTVERLLFAAPAGVLRGPSPVNGGWIVFRVQKVTALKRQTLETATAAIRQDLAGIAQVRAVERYLTALRRRWQPQTRCSSAVTSATYCRAS